MENLVNTIMAIQTVGAFQKDVPENEEMRRMLIKKIHSSAISRLSNLVLYYAGIATIVIIARLVF